MKLRVVALLLMFSAVLTGCQASRQEQQALTRRLEEGFLAKGSLYLEEREYPVRMAFHDESFTLTLEDSPEGWSVSVQQDTVRTSYQELNHSYSVHTPVGEDSPAVLLREALSSAQKPQKVTMQKDAARMELSTPKGAVLTLRREDGSPLELTVPAAGMRVLFREVLPYKNETAPANAWLV